MWLGRDLMISSFLLRTSNLATIIFCRMLWKQAYPEQQKISADVFWHRHLVVTLYHTETHFQSCKLETLPLLEKEANLQIENYLSLTFSPRLLVRYFKVISLPCSIWKSFPIFVLLGNLFPPNVRSNEQNSDQIVFESLVLWLLAEEVDNGRLIVGFDSNIWIIATNPRNKFETTQTDNQWRISILNGFTTTNTTNKKKGRFGSIEVWYTAERFYFVCQQCACPITNKYSLSLTQRASFTLKLSNDEEPYFCN